MRFSIFALAASLSTSAAVYQGFNYGSTKADGSCHTYDDFKSLFNTAKGLAGTNGGFTSARLYTMIQCGSSTNEPISAIQAAIDTQTSLLLGLWASGGQGGMSAEITALKSAITQYGDDFTKLVAGISVGSEDLYRSSPTGVAANAGIGADAATVASYISQVRDAIKGTSLANSPIGHVDTWTAWTEGGVDAVISACDFIGMDAYPYFQNSMANSITEGKRLFNEALAATQAAAGGKPVWITETGFPVSGKTENQAVPGTENAKTYYDEVGCPNFGKVNTWWFTLQDTNGATPNPSFGLIGSSYSTTPLYDLSCADVSSASPSSTATSSSTSSTEPSSTSSSGQSPTTGVSVTPSETAISPGATISNDGNGNDSGSPTPTPTSTGQSSTQTPNPTSTGPDTAGGSNAANAISGSFAGVVGAIMVAVAAF